MEWYALNQDNGTEWDIGSWCWWLSLLVEQHSKSRHECALSQVSIYSNVILDITGFGCSFCGDLSSFLMDLLLSWPLPSLLYRSWRLRTTPTSITCTQVLTCVTISMRFVYKILQSSEMKVFSGQQCVNQAVIITPTYPDITWAVTSYK